MGGWHWSGHQGGPPQEEGVEQSLGFSLFWVPFPVFHVFRSVIVGQTVPGEWQGWGHCPVSPMAAPCPPLPEQGQDRELCLSPGHSQSPLIQISGYSIY